MKDLIRRWRIGHNDRLLGRAWPLVLTILFTVLAVFTLPLGLVGLATINTAQQFDWNVWNFTFEMIQIYTAQSPGWLDSTTPVPLSYDMAQVLGPLSTGYALFSTAAVVLGDRSRALRARVAHGHVIVCGTGRAGVELTRSVATVARCVLVGQDVASPKTSTSLVRRTLALSGDPRDTVVLRRAGVRRAREIFAVDDRGDVNAAVAVAAKRATLTRHGVLQCFAVIDNPDLQLTLQARLLGRVSSSHLDVHLLDRHQLLASAIVVHEVPEPDALTLVVGDGPTAVALGLAVVRSLTDAVRPAGARAVLYLGGGCAAEVEQTARRRWPAVTDHVNLVVRRSNLPDSFERMTVSAPKATVFVSARTDDTTLQTGLMWLNNGRVDVHRVVFCMDAETGLSGAFTPGASGMFEAQDSVVRVYSRSLALADPDHLRNQSLTERLARAMHELYRAQENPGPTASDAPTPGVLLPWEALPDWLKAPNRDQARDVGRKMSEMNFAVVPARGARTEFRFSAADVETLARMEHSRWMTERRGRGFVVGAQRTDRTHPDMVPWEDLSDRGRDKDRMFIRGLPGLLHAEGFEIVPLPVNTESRTVSRGPL